MTKKLGDLKVSELKTELDKRGLEKSGIKNVLIARLEEAMKSNGEDPEKFEFDSQMSQSIDGGDSELDTTNPEKVNEEQKTTEDAQQTKSEDVNRQPSQAKADDPIEQEHNTLDFEENQDEDSSNFRQPQTTPGGTDLDLGPESGTDLDMGLGNTAPASEETKNEELPPKRHLWISNLSPKTKAAKLEEICCKYGVVQGIKIVASNKGAKLYSFVSMSNEDEALQAKRSLNRQEINDTHIQVELVRWDPSTPEGSKLTKQEREKEGNPTGHKPGKDEAGSTAASEDGTGDKKAPSTTRSPSKEPRRENGVPARKTKELDKFEEGPLPEDPVEKDATIEELRKRLKLERTRLSDVRYQKRTSNLSMQRQMDELRHRLSLSERRSKDMHIERSQIQHATVELRRDREIYGRRREDLARAERAIEDREMKLRDKERRIEDEKRRLRDEEHRVRELKHSAPPPSAYYSGMPPEKRMAVGGATSTRPDDRYYRATTGNQGRGDHGGYGASTDYGTGGRVSSNMSGSGVPMATGGLSRYPLGGAAGGMGNSTTLSQQTMNFMSSMSNNSGLRRY